MKKNQTVGWVWVVHVGVIHALNSPRLRINNEHPSSLINVEKELSQQVELNNSKPKSIIVKRWAWLMSQAKYPETVNAANLPINWRGWANWQEASVGLPVILNPREGCNRSWITVTLFDTLCIGTLDPLFRLLLWKGVRNGFGLTDPQDSDPTHP